MRNCLLTFNSCELNSAADTFALAEAAGLKRRSDAKDSPAGAMIKCRSAVEDDED